MERGAETPVATSPTDGPRTEGISSTPSRKPGLVRRGNKSPAGTIRTEEPNDEVPSGVRIAVQEEDRRMGRFCGRPSLSG